MKYFRLTEDRKTGHRPQFIDWYKDLKSQKQDDVILFRIKEDSELIIPDILLIPMVMVNRQIKDIFVKYEPNASIHQVMLINRNDSEPYEFYRIEIPEVTGIEEGKNLDKVIFKVSDVYESQIIVRLDFMESILRRDAVGFDIKEV